MHGWICPKCQGANGPSVTRCPCSPIARGYTYPALPIVSPTNWPGTDLTPQSGSVDTKDYPPTQSWG